MKILFRRIAGKKKENINVNRCSRMLVVFFLLKKNVIELYMTVARTYPERKRMWKRNEKKIDR